ncbi:MAG TPA: RNA polymerase sigma factor [Thermoanaerobaculia bacterium]|nr:RNA polymerase sigma factor [Thermoanaerobaculia bacterium]
MFLARIVEEVVHGDGARILAGLIRIARDFDAAEDALQEAYARALVAWRRDGIPDRPAAWLNTVSRRIALDRIRRDRTAALPEDLEVIAPEADEEDPSGIEDDRLRLLFTCCHPALSPEARCALALRTLGGLSTREIARAFVEPEATTAQRLVRAKKKIREARIPYEVPSRENLPARVAAVLSVLYLIFNEGYASTDAPSLLRPDLVIEAIRLARLTMALLPEEAEAKGLLALMLLTDARRAARLSADGELVPLEEQDRALWNRAQIEEGVNLLDGVLALRTPGPYQIQAAIAALHVQAQTPAQTDWAQIAALYETLLRFTPTPIVELNAAIAMGMATSLEHALARIERIEASGALARYYLLPAAKADLLRRLGRREQAAESYRAALELATNPIERRYLEQRALGPSGTTSVG